MAEPSVNSDPDADLPDGVFMVAFKCPYEKEMLELRSLFTRSDGIVSSMWWSRVDLMHFATKIDAYRYRAPSAFTMQRDFPLMAAELGDLKKSTKFFGSTASSHPVGIFINDDYISEFLEIVSVTQRAVGFFESYMRQIREMARRWQQAPAPPAPEPPSPPPPLTMEERLIVIQKRIEGAAEIQDMILRRLAHNQELLEAVLRKMDMTTPSETSTALKKAASLLYAKAKAAEAEGR